MLKQLLILSLCTQAQLFGTAQVHPPIQTPSKPSSASQVPCTNPSPAWALFGCPQLPKRCQNCMHTVIICMQELHKKNKP